MNIDNFLNNIINNSKNEKLVQWAKSWTVLKGDNIDYKPIDNIVQVLSPNWESEILNDSKLI